MSAPPLSSAAELPAKVTAVTRELDALDRSIREELQGAARLRDSVAEATSEQGRLTSSVQDARAAHSLLSCQHEDLNALLHLRNSNVYTLAKEDSTLKSEVEGLRGQLQKNAASFLMRCTEFQSGFGFAELEARSAQTVAEEKLSQQQIQQSIAVLRHRSQEVANAREEARASERHAQELEAAMAEVKSSTEDVTRRHTVLGSKEAAHCAAKHMDGPREWEELSSLQEEIESLRGCMGAQDQESDRLQQANISLRAHIQRKEGELSRLDKSIAALTTPARTSHRHDAHPLFRYDSGEDPKPKQHNCGVFSAAQGGSWNNGQNSEGMRAQKAGDRTAVARAAGSVEALDEEFDVQPAHTPLQPAGIAACVLEETTVTRVTPDKYGNLQRDTVTMRHVRHIPVSRIASGGGASNPPRAKTVLFHETHEAFKIGDPSATEQFLGSIFASVLGVGGAPNVASKASRGRGQQLTVRASRRVSGSASTGRGRGQGRGSGSARGQGHAKPREMPQQLEASRGTSTARSTGVEIVLRPTAGYSKAMASAQAPAKRLPKRRRPMQRLYTAESMLSPWEDAEAAKQRWEEQEDAELLQSFSCSYTAL